MIREAIGLLLRNLPAFFFVAALLSATFLRDGKSMAERFLAWIYCCRSALRDFGLPLRIFSFPRWLRLTLDGRQAPSNSKLGWPISLSASPHVSPFGETCRSKPARSLSHRYSCSATPSGMFGKW
jgi:hypothetical protein